MSALDDTRQRDTRLLDGLLRGVGLEHGLTELDDEETLGSAEPSRDTAWSSAAIDATFLLGGLLFARAAHLASRRVPADRRTAR
jgi:hypothetical protein